ncbi:MAG TPA: transporter [Allosphingosinicella sp.]|jgi:hypothetical protein
MTRFILAALLAGAAAPALAQAAPEDEPAICTDRPSKANGTCTVPAGKVQLETDLLNWTRTSSGGTRTDVILHSSPTLKLGLTDRSEIQVNIVPYETVETRSGGVRDRIGGVGDLFVRFKQRVTGAGSKVEVAFLPFVKIPTARRGIGNGEVEGGLSVPVDFKLAGGTTLTFGPELDLLLDQDGSGRHLNVVNVVNLSHPLTGKLTLMGELWGDQDLDPAGTSEQYSADVALTYAAGKTLQLDAGANFGLNRNTPDAQVYVGLSTRL